MVQCLGFVAGWESPAGGSIAGKLFASRLAGPMDSDTDLGGPAAVFPATRCGLVSAAGSTDPAVRKQAFEVLLSVYWKPVYKYIRVKWALNNEDAKDVTQAFFARALEKGFFDPFDPARAQFRTFLRVCVDGFVAKERRAATRLKRGGDVELLSLDFEGADGELLRHAVAAGTDPDDFFRQEWVRGLFGLAVEDLRRESTASGKDTHFALFRRYDLDGPNEPQRLTYAQLGREFDLSETQVTNYLAHARRRFRQLVLERLHATTGSEEEFREECRRLFGGGVP
ncbi:MAG TPA: sigma-70 family RNA polymerase sigma factor [Gemmataceae bacterium]|nr:sigma-70 family RNA polymerase sigma factor [Gemmataceae bacterium]